VRWFATFLAERTKAETEIAKLLFESTRFEGKIEDLYRDIGKRVVELKEKGKRPYGRILLSSSPLMR